MKATSFESCKYALKTQKIFIGLWGLPKKNDKFDLRKIKGIL